MKTKIELEENIMNILDKIHGEFPELSKYITEMPLMRAESEEVVIRNLKDYYDSLEGLVAKYSKTHLETIVRKEDKTPEVTGYPIYPPSEDIYEQLKEETEIDPEDLSKKKIPNKGKIPFVEKDFKYHRSGDDLDVPGSELDDQQESVGSEDEENNYYSLGGDNHNDLEEDKG